MVNSQVAPAPGWFDGERPPWFVSGSSGRDSRPWLLILAPSGPKRTWEIV